MIDVNLLIYDNKWMDVDCERNCKCFIMICKLFNFNRIPSLVAVDFRSRRWRCIVIVNLNIFAFFCRILFYENHVLILIRSRLYTLINKHYYLPLLNRTLTYFTKQNAS